MKGNLECHVNHAAKHVAKSKSLMTPCRFFIQINQTKKASIKEA